ncbi:MAG: Tn3 family resolvase, partial [Cupriavidus necator]
PVAETRLTLHLFIERNSKFVRGKSKAHRWIEDFCLAKYGMRCLNKRRTECEIVMPFSHGPELEAAIEDLLAEMHATADLCHCWIEASLHDPVAGTAWS